MECAFNPERAPERQRGESQVSNVRNLTPLVALMAAVIALIALTTDSVGFILPVIGAAAILLLTFALLFVTPDNDRPTARPDETERHNW